MSKEYRLYFDGFGSGYNLRGMVVLWLAGWTIDSMVRRSDGGWFEARLVSFYFCVVSLDKELYSTLFLFTQALTIFILLGVTLCWTYSNTPRCFMLQKLG